MRRVAQSSRLASEAEELRSDDGDSPELKFNKRKERARLEEIEEDEEDERALHPNWGALG